MTPLLWPTLTLGLALAQDPGADTTKAVTELPSTPAPPTFSGARYALIIGVNDYQDAGLVDLQFAVNDARRVAAQLMSTGSYTPDKVVLMHTGHRDPTLRPTRANILTQLELLTRRAEGAEQVLVYFSGHGLGGAEGETRQNYLLPADTRLLVPEDTAVRLERDVVDRVNTIKAQQKLVILDACRNERERGAKSLTPTGTLVDTGLEQSAGLQVIYSAAFGSVSYEEPSLQGGAFTWHFVEGLRCAADGVLTGARDGVVTVDELFSYTGRQLAQSPSGRVQQPTRGGETTGDFALARVPLDCRPTIPEPPELWAYQDVRRGTVLGAAAGGALLGTGLSYLAWSQAEARGGQSAWRLTNYGLNAAALGLGGAALVVGLGGVLEWREDHAAWAAAQGLGGGQVRLTPTLAPVGAGWGAGVVVRW